MASPSFFSRVQVAFQSAKAAAVTIDNITKANPAVVSYTTGTDPTNGDFVLLRANGMTEVADRVFRVANVNGAGNTFDLEGVNSTSFGTYNTTDKGTFEVITFDTTLTSAVTINASGGEPEFEDITTIHDDIRKRVPVVNSPFNIQMELLWDPADSSQAALGLASDEKTERAFRLIFSNGKRLVGNGYISATGIPTGQAQGVVRTSLTIEGQGRPITYAT